MRDEPNTLNTPNRLKTPNNTFIESFYTPKKQINKEMFHPPSFLQYTEPFAVDYETLSTIEKYDDVKYKSFGLDISEQAKQKLQQLRTISTPKNIIIQENFYPYMNRSSCSKNINWNSPHITNYKLNQKSNDRIPPFVNPYIQFTPNERHQIEIAKQRAVHVVETYEPETNSIKYKSFGLALKNSNPETLKLSTTFRAIRFQSDIQLPKQFNGIEVWKDFLAPITDQGKCGNCWAHASSAVLQDRFAIMSLGKIKFIPSPYELTICSFDFQHYDITKTWKNEELLAQMDEQMRNQRGCNGNNLYDTATTLFTDGVTELSCFGRTIDNNGASIDINKSKQTDFPLCYNVTGLEFDTCVDGKTPMRKYRCKTAYLCHDQNDHVSLKERKMMYDIYKYGPIIAGFMLYPDFVYDYDGKSIYTHADKNGGQLGGHAIRLVGWGEEMQNGELIKYWWVANSWGKDWGINGYFRCQRGLVDLQMEENVMSVLPDFPGMTIDDPNLEAVETDTEKQIQNFTGHVLDTKTGYYQTAIDKLQKCELRGKMYPYIDPNFIPKLPVYKEFFAANVTDFINNKIKDVTYNNSIPTYFCNEDYNPSETPIPSDIVPSDIVPSVVPVPDNLNISSTGPFIKSVVLEINNKKCNCDCSDNSTNFQTKNQRSKEILNNPIVQPSYSSNNETNNSNFCKIIKNSKFELIYFGSTLAIGIVLFGIIYLLNKRSTNETNLQNTILQNQNLQNPISQYQNSQNPISQNPISQYQNLQNTNLQ
jgi:hypothetical protein